MLGERVEAVGPSSASNGWRQSNIPAHVAGSKRSEQKPKPKTVVQENRPMQSRSQSGSNWIPPPGWEESLSSKYQKALKHLREQGKTQIPMRMDEHNFSSPPPRATSMGYGAGRKHPMIASQEGSADYQMQLMLLEQQNRKRLRLVRQEQDSMSNACPKTPRLGRETISGSREQSVESEWSMQFTPESTPGFMERRGSDGLGCAAAGESRADILHKKLLVIRERQEDLREE